MPIRGWSNGTMAIWRRAMSQTRSERLRPDSASSLSAKWFRSKRGAKFKSRRIGIATRHGRHRTGFPPRASWGAPSGGAMPYQSKAEREAASHMTWREVLTHVEEATQCDAKEARRRIGNARENHMLCVRWADQRKDFGRSGPVSMPSDEPPRDSQYWQECKTNPNDPDLVLEPPPYDRGLVHKRT